MLSFNDLELENITIDLQGFETGYYRFFIKTNQTLYWDNIYIDNNGADVSQLFDFWGIN